MIMNINTKAVGTRFINYLKRCKVPYESMKGTDGRTIVFIKCEDRTEKLKKYIAKNINYCYVASFTSIRIDIEEI